MTLAELFSSAAAANTTSTNTIVIRNSIPKPFKKKMRHFSIAPKNRLNLGKNQVKTFPLANTKLNLSGSDMAECCCAKSKSSSTTHLHSYKIHRRSLWLLSSSSSTSSSSSSPSALLSTYRYRNHSRENSGSSNATNDLHHNVGKASQKTTLKVEKFFRISRVELPWHQWSVRQWWQGWCGSLTHVQWSGPEWQPGNRLLVKFWCREWLVSREVKTVGDNFRFSP